MWRVSWIAAVVLIAVVAGYALAVVLIPRDSDELPPPAVTIERTITIPPGEPVKP